VRIRTNLDVQGAHDALTAPRENRQFAGAKELFRESLATYAESGTTVGMIARVERWASGEHRIMRDPVRAMHRCAAAEPSLAGRSLAADRSETRPAGPRPCSLVFEG
jgi:hypothetical protein